MLDGRGHGRWMLKDFLGSVLGELEDFDDLGFIQIQHGNMSLIALTVTYYS